MKKGYNVNRHRLDNTWKSAQHCWRGQLRWSPGGFVNTTFKFICVFYSYNNMMVCNIGLPCTKMLRIVSYEMLFSPTYIIRHFFRFWIMTDDSFKNFKFSATICICRFQHYFSNTARYLCRLSITRLSDINTTTEHSTFRMSASYTCLDVVWVVGVLTYLFKSLHWDLWTFEKSTNEYCLFKQTICRVYLPSVSQLNICTLYIN